MIAPYKAIGLDGAQSFFEQLPDVAEQSAVLSINSVVEGSGMVTFRREMRKQTNFPAGYLEGERLRVGKRATRGVMEATIRGRDRATSLARFAEGQNAINTRGRGVRVEVKRGQGKVLRKAFIVNLRNGNVGVAVRVKPGESLQHSTAAVRLSDNVFLLYGPSVDQVFRGVADDVAPDIGQQLSKEFLRQFTRLSRG